MKEFERFEWFEWFEWLGPSPTEPFNSASNAFVLRVAQEHEAPGLRHVEQLENSFDRIECVVEGVPHVRNVEIVPRETRVQALNRAADRHCGRVESEAVEHFQIGPGVPVGRNHGDPTKPAAVQVTRSLCLF